MERLRCPISSRKQPKNTHLPQVFFHFARELLSHGWRSCPRAQEKPMLLKYHFCQPCPSYRLLKVPSPSSRGVAEPKMIWFELDLGVFVYCDLHLDFHGMSEMFHFQQETDKKNTRLPQVFLHFARELLSHGWSSCPRAQEKPMLLKYHFSQPWNQEARKPIKP